ncbi:hypothetical protein JOD52_001174 [Brachybacterium muris]|uniref:MarR family transcriptional regulator n=2 Tax=Brachybacterium muris TaxID=219301 RepID=UPI00195801F4|nr:helix-turn-helix domain-containing protein [Brachybacterium muris]MBM7500334.1 hypothetical protein [Brachybacterium muris]
MDVASVLRELGLDLIYGAGDDLWMLRDASGGTLAFIPTDPVERLDARTVRRLGRGPTTGHARTLLIGSRATRDVTQRAAAGEIDILTENPLRLYREGVAYRAEEPTPVLSAPRRAGRPAWVRWALLRELIRGGSLPDQAELAARLGVTQQAVSRALRTLNGMGPADPAGWLDLFLEEYPGPGGKEFGWYGLEPVTQQTSTAVSLAHSLELDPVVGGDVAADHHAPWKLPTRSRIYLRGPMDLGGEGFVPAPLAEATLICCTPRDRTLWVTGRESPDGVPHLVADPVLVLWELLHSDDPDSDQAAAALRTVILEGGAQ